MSIKHPEYTVDTICQCEHFLLLACFRIEYRKFSGVLRAEIENDVNHMLVALESRQRELVEWVPEAVPVWRYCRERTK